MKNNKLKARIAALAAAGLVILGSHSSAKSATALKISDAPPPDDTKPYHQILKDAENFNADTDIVFEESKGFSRLKMSESTPVIIKYNENINDREKKLIEKVVKYYNKLFTTINENYKFQICSQNDNISKESTIIEIKNQDSLEYKDTDANGQAQMYADKGKQGQFIIYAEILLDWTQLKDYNDSEIYRIILHEFTHTLGFNDVYFAGNVKNCNTIDMSTFMRTYNRQDINYLYPNDYAVLQVLYSNEYTKHGNYEDVIEVVNNKIEEYTKSFYKKYADMLIEKGTATENLLEEEIKQNITWRSVFTDNNYTYNIKINDNRNCEFSLYDEKGNLLEKSNGEVMLVNGILFIRNINIKSAKNYNKKANDDLQLKLIISFYIDKCGTLVVNDGLSIINSYPTFKEEAPKISK